MIMGGQATESNVGGRIVQVASRRIFCTTSYARLRQVALTLPKCTHNTCVLPLCKHNLAPTSAIGLLIIVFI